MGWSVESLVLSCAKPGEQACLCPGRCPRRRGRGRRRASVGALPCYGLEASSLGGEMGQHQGPPAYTVFFFFKIFICGYFPLVLERRERRGKKSGGTERERETAMCKRNIHQLPPDRGSNPHPVGALTGNQIYDLFGKWPNGRDALLPFLFSYHLNLKNGDRE